MSILDLESDFGNVIYRELLEAQAEANSDPRWLSHEEVFGSLRKKITNYIESSKKLEVKDHHAN